MVLCVWVSRRLESFTSSVFFLAALWDQWGTRENHRIRLLNSIVQTTGYFDEIYVEQTLVRSVGSAALQRGKRKMMTWHSPMFLMKPHTMQAIVCEIRGWTPHPILGWLGLPYRWWYRICFTSSTWAWAGIFVARFWPWCWKNGLFLKLGPWRNGWHLHRNRYVLSRDWKVGRSRWNGLRERSWGGDQVFTQSWKQVLPTTLQLFHAGLNRCYNRTPNNTQSVAPCCGRSTLPWPSFMVRIAGFWALKINPGWKLWDLFFCRCTCAWRSMPFRRTSLFSDADRNCIFWTICCDPGGA